MLVYDLIIVNVNHIIHGHHPGGVCLVESGIALAVPSVLALEPGALRLQELRLRLHLLLLLRLFSAGSVVHDALIRGTASPIGIIHIVEVVLCRHSWGGASPLILLAVGSLHHQVVVVILIHI